MESEFYSMAPAVYNPPTAGVLELAVESGFAATVTPSSGTFNAEGYTNGGEV